MPNPPFQVADNYGTAIPEDHDLKAWTMAPELVSGSMATGFTGYVYMTKMMVRQPMEVGVVHFNVATAYSGNANTFVGLYDYRGNLLAASADITTLVQSTGRKEVPLTTRVALAKGYYYIGFFTGTYASGNLAASPSGGLGNFHLQPVNVKHGNINVGGTTPPATVDLSGAAIGAGTIQFPFYAVS